MRKSILIAESGSTKTNWVLISNNESSYETTIGFNPFILNSNDVYTELSGKEFFSTIANKQIEVFFYGSGCSTTKRKQIIADALKKLFPNAEISVMHDIDAAVNATCDGKPGIVGILGTGSNSVYFNGKVVNYGHPSPGYLLGDEGGGVHIGKTLIRDVLYRVPPSEILAAFYEKYQLSPTELIDAVYSAERPNAYIASFAEFLSDFKDHHYTEELIYKCFSKFLKYHAAQFEDAHEAPLHLVGSIAFHFENIIAEALSEWKIEKGKILKSPLEGLVDYHTKTN